MKCEYCNNNMELKSALCRCDCVIEEYYCKNCRNFVKLEIEQFIKKISELKDIIENKSFKNKKECFKAYGDFLEFLIDKDILCLYNDRFPDSMDKFQEYLGMTDKELDEIYDEEMEKDL